jgi:hypothetical protein
VSEGHPSDCKTDDADDDEDDSYDGGNFQCDLFAVRGLNSMELLC